MEQVVINGDYNRYFVQKDYIYDVETYVPCPHV